MGSKESVQCHFYTKIHAKKTSTREQLLGERGERSLKSFRHFNHLSRSV